MSDADRPELDRPELDRPELPGRRRPDDLLLGRVSHDLRSPLGAILGAAELIDLRAGAAVAMETSAIRIAVARLGMMIDDLVFTADASRGRRRVGPAALVDVREIVAGAVDTAETTRIGSHASAHLNPAPTPMLAVTHAAEATRVIGQLIVNARQHSALRRVDVEVGRGDGAVTVVVADDGLGPDEERWHEWAGRGVRGEHASGAGLGLGLSVVAAIASHIGIEVALVGRHDRRAAMVTIPRVPIDTGTMPVLVSESLDLYLRLTARLGDDVPIQWVRGRDALDVMRDAVHDVGPTAGGHPVDQDVPAIEERDGDLMFECRPGHVEWSHPAADPAAVELLADYLIDDARRRQ